MRLPEDKRRCAYFAFHPLLGADALSRQQLNRQFAVAGFHVDDLLNALDPARAGRPDDWTSRTAPGVRVVLAPANTHGCRDEYEFHGANEDLPQTIRLCREAKSHQQVLDLDGSFDYAGYRLPERVVLKQGTHPIGEILIGAADLQRWRDMAHYERTSLGGTD